MTEKEILYKAILKAEKNGYTNHIKYLPLISQKNINLEKLLIDIFYLHKEEIIYSKSFAKAFFGKEDKMYREDAWIYRLREMSIKDDDIKYLEKFLDK